VVLSVHSLNNCIKLKHSGSGGESLCVVVLLLNVRRHWVSWGTYSVLEYFSVLKELLWYPRLANRSLNLMGRSLMELRSVCSHVRSRLPRWHVAKFSRVHCFSQGEFRNTFYCAQSINILGLIISGARLHLRLLALAMMGECTHWACSWDGLLASWSLESAADIVFSWRRVLIAREWVTLCRSKRSLTRAFLWKEWTVEVGICVRNSSVDWVDLPAESAFFSHWPWSFRRWWISALAYDLGMFTSDN
jgi:hypothetical protein